MRALAVLALVTLGGCQPPDGGSYDPVAGAALLQTGLGMMSAPAYAPAYVPTPVETTCYGLSYGVRCSSY